MRLLREGVRPLATLAAVCTLAALATPAGAHPPNEPDHGVNETVACTLWADDVDEANASAYEEQIDENTTDVCALAAVTDVPLDAPPEAVERWNRGDLGHFPETGSDTSVYPEHADRRDSVFIEDAHATIFAVQPSTTALLSPSDQPRYVAPNGTLLGTVDYRVEIPGDVLGDDRRVQSTLLENEITETRLLVDGVRESNSSGTKTPIHDYRLSGTPSVPQTLTLEADIAVEVRERIEVCIRSTSDGSCEEWDVDVEVHVDELTVRDSIEVVEYDLEVTGMYARYPDGDLGLLVYANNPWLGYTVPDGDVHGVWRFYVARDPAWDTLVRETSDGRTVDHSPLHPLSVHAFPVETQPTSTPHTVVQILAVLGNEQTPPTLPDDVLLDVETDRYRTSYGIATRIETTDGPFDERAFGLVRGVEADLQSAGFSEVSIRRSNLSLSVLDRTDENVTVRVNLTDATTGVPIDTSRREGFVRVKDRRVNTSADGTIVETFSGHESSISATYVPGDWWLDSRSYVGDSDVLYVRGGGSALARVLFEFAVPFSLFLFGVFVIDRFTNWHVWPPWRRL